MTLIAEADRALLLFEESFPGHTAAKSERIRKNFELSAARYYQTLYRLLGDPKVIAEFPVLANRTKRLLEARVRLRSARRLPARA